MNVEAQIVAAKLVGYIDMVVSIGFVEHQYVPSAVASVRATVFCNLAGRWVFKITERVRHACVTGRPITHFAVMLFGMWYAKSLGNTTYTNGGDIIMTYSIEEPLCP